MFTPYKKALIQRAQQGESCTLQERCLHCSRSSAVNHSSDGGKDNQASTQHENASEIPSEGRGRDMEERAMPMTGALLEPVVTPETSSVLTMIPVPTSMTPVTVPDAQGLRVNIVPGLEGAKIEIHPLNSNSSSSEEEEMDKTLPRPKLGGSLFLGVGLHSRSEGQLSQPLRGILERTLTWLPSQHLASYPSVERISHFVQESLPLGPLIVQTSRFFAHSTGRRILRPLRATPYSPEASQPGADQRNGPALRRLLLLLDATAAHALSGIDHLVLLFREAGGKVCRWLVSSASQLRDLAGYLNRTYYQEADKWAGASDIVVFCGAVSFTVAVGAFDALVYVAEWFFDGRAVREIEKREKETAV